MLKSINRWTILLSNAQLGRLNQGLFYFLFGCQKQRGSDPLVHHPKTSMPRGKKTRKEKGRARISIFRGK
jgi:hypothetical protein